jgi:hypothetical protein
LVCSVLFECGVLFCVICINCVLRLIVVPLTPGKTSFEVQIIIIIIIKIIIILHCHGNDSSPTFAIHHISVVKKAASNYSKNTSDIK